MRKLRLGEVELFPHSFMESVFSGQLSGWEVWRPNPGGLAPKSMLIQNYASSLRKVRKEKTGNQ